MEDGRPLVHVRPYMGTKLKRGKEKKERRHGWVRGRGGESASAPAQRPATTHDAAAALEHDSA